MRRNFAFGTAVRVLRTAQRMTQADLASAAGISRRQLIRIEAGEAEATLVTYDELVAALGFDSGDQLMKAARR